MAKKRRRAKKLTQTQQYNRKLTGIEYLADISEAVSALYEQSRLGKRKRATKKQLKEAEKVYKEAREILRSEGFEDIPSLTTILKHLEFKQEQLHQSAEAILEEAVWENEDEEIVVIEVGKIFVTHFRQHLERIYLDTISNVMQDQGAKIAEYWRSKAEPAYTQAVEMLDSIITAANNDYEMVARAIKAQPDYEVILATDYLAPSDMEEFFDLCIDFFTAVMIDVQTELNS